MSDMGLSCLKNEKIKLVLSFLKVFAVLLTLLTSCAFPVVSVSADADDDKKCNDGDVVTVVYPSEVVDYQNTDEDDDVWKEVEVTVGGKVVAGKNYTIAIRCEGEHYKFSELKVSDGRQTSTQAHLPFLLEDIESGNAVGHVEIDGVDVAFQMKSVKQNERTTDPDTTADDAFDPTQSVAENNENGNVTVADDRIDVGADDLVVCQSAKGAESLGWIVCPALTWMAKASDTIYTEYVAPNLQVQPELFSGGNSNVRDAWGTFRDMANVIFVVLLLFVIFSQLTGVGIDNYGIKRILPKMIVAAIMINLSYLICVLLVDISNILGNGLQAIFASFSSQLGEKGVIQLNALPDSEFLVDNVPQPSFNIGSVLSGIGLFGAAAVMVGAIWANPAIILSLFIGGLGIVVSIFFLFVLLAARKAAIVVLTVISPLAVAAYMLPNTKKLFDKWWNFFEGLLLVYPIAGLLVGAGDYISRLLLVSTDGFIMWITAMVVSVAPIFFIPSVLKSAFAAMGKIGGMLAGMGVAASRRATGTIRNSEGFKNASQMGRDRRLRIRAGYNEKTGGLTTAGRARAKLAQTRFGRLAGMDKRQAARLAQAEKNSAIGAESMAMLAGETSAAEINKYIASGKTKEDYFRDQFDKSNGDITKMNSIISAAKSRGVRPKDIAKMIRDAENSGSLTFKDAQSRANWMNELSSKHGDVLSTDFELMTWVQKGGNERLGDYGEYAAAGGVKIDDLKPEDVLKLSGDSLAGMIASGKLTQSMAKRVQAMNPNISEDKRIMLGAAASGAATVTSIGGNVEQFKTDVNALMGNHGVTTTTTIVGTTSGMVDAWTANTPQDTVIRDVDIRRADGGTTTTSTLTVDTAEGGRADEAMQAMKQNTGDIVLTTRQGAINANRTAKAAEQNVMVNQQTASEARKANTQLGGIKNDTGNIGKDTNTMVGQNQQIAANSGQSLDVLREIANTKADGASGDGGAAGGGGASGDGGAAGSSDGAGDSGNSGDSGA